MMKVWESFKFDTSYRSLQKESEKELEYEYWRLVEQLIDLGEKYSGWALVKFVGLKHIICHFMNKIADQID